MIVNHEKSSACSVSYKGWRAKNIFLESADKVNKAVIINWAYRGIVLEVESIASTATQSSITAPLQKTKLRILLSVLVSQMEVVYIAGDMER